MRAFVAIPLLFALIIGVITAAALAVGSLLAHMFAVTTFEATVVVLAVAATVVYAIHRGAPLAGDAELTDGVGDVAEPVVIFDPFPLPPRHARRRKR